MKSKEQLRKRKDLNRRQGFRVSKSMLLLRKRCYKKSRKLLTKRLAMQMTRTEARQEQHMAAVRAAGEALKLLQSEKPQCQVQVPALIVTQVVAIGNWSYARGCYHQQVVLIYQSNLVFNVLPGKFKLNLFRLICLNLNECTMWRLT